MKKFLSIIILLCAGIAYGQDDPNALIAKIAQLEKTIARQEHIIEKQETKLEEQEKEIKRLLALCRQNGIETNPRMLRQGPKAYGIPAHRFNGLKVGQIAYLGSGNSLKVEQIIDKQNAIAVFKIEIRPKNPNPKDPFDGKVVTDTYRTPTGTQINYAYPEYTQHVWVRGISTQNLVDGSYIKTDKPLKVTGTKTIDGNVLFGSTVFLLEPYKPSQDSNEPNQ